MSCKAGVEQFFFYMDYPALDGDLDSRVWIYGNAWRASLFTFQLLTISLAFISFFFLNGEILCLFTLSFWIADACFYLFMELIR